ncbi:MAG: NAD-dependent epimerase/dehydratase family protein [Dehalococcoidales bacterium]|nr:NAD-dependent epimerase/dehydratase family protein [Dehalococcoidales bacterium]
MTKYFVTGGAGFIGSHLSEKLLSEGNQVTVYDNLASGSKENIKHLIGKNGFQFIQNDLLNTTALNEAMKGHNIVWHLGANTDIPTGNKVTDLDLKNCTIATRNVLEAMRANNIDKILFSSSACVYGDAPPVALSETFGPLLPINMYGAGKLACEGLMGAYSHLFGIKVWMFRFANVVGDRMGHGVIFDFIQKLKKNPKELEILGDGKQEKPFFLVEDCVSGMICAFQKSKSQCDVFNLGTETFTTVTRIGEIVTEEMGLKNVKFKYTGGRRGWPGDAPVIHFSVNKMKKLGWQASHSSDEAVRIAARRLLGK